MPVFNNGINKRQLDYGIVQDLFNDGSPTTSFTFPVAIWDRVIAAGSITIAGTTYVIGGSNPTHHAHGYSEKPGTVKYTFWPIHRKS